MHPSPGCLPHDREQAVCLGGTRGRSRIAADRARRAAQSTGGNADETVTSEAASTLNGPLV